MSTRIFCPTKTLKDYITVYSRGLYAPVAIKNDFYRGVVRTFLILKTGKEPTYDEITQEIYNYKPLFMNCTPINNMIITNHLIIPAVGYKSSLLGGVSRQKIITNAIKLMPDNSTIEIKKGVDFLSLCRFTLRRDNVVRKEKSSYLIKRKPIKQTSYLGM